MAVGVVAAKLAQAKKVLRLQFAQHLLQRQAGTFYAVAVHGAAAIHQKLHLNGRRSLRLGGGGQAWAQTGHEHRFIGLRAISRHAAHAGRWQLVEQHNQIAVQPL